MDLAQLGHLRSELLTVLRCGLQFIKKGSHLFVVGENLGHESLSFLVLPEDREKVLFLKPGEQFELRPEVREQLFAGLYCAIRGVHELCEKIISLGGTGLKKLSDRRHTESSLKLSCEQMILLLWYFANRGTRGSPVW